MAQHVPDSKLVKPLRSGQITIPAEFRKRLGITEESVLEISVDDEELRLRVVEVQRPVSQTSWYRDLYDMFAPARAEAVERGYTEEELDADIDAAVRAIRQTSEI